MTNQDNQAALKSLNEYMSAPLESHRQRKTLASYREWLEKKYKPTPPTQERRKIG